MFSADQGVTPSSILYAEDVFSTFLYAGTGAAQTINNGINLSGKGGLVWIKNRGVRAHALYDTARGALFFLSTNSTDGTTGVIQSLTSFNNNGFTLGDGQYDANLNNSSGYNYASWTFRKAPKFFDIVTYTGDDTSVRALSHNLGVTPGMVIVKNTGVADDWYVAIKGDAGTYYRTDGGTNDGALNNTLRLGGPYDLVFYNYMSSSIFVPQVVTEGVSTKGNASGNNYVAYLFADDTSTTGLIRCGSFTTDASGSASVTSLGWEPQFLLAKAASTTGDWIMLDIMRGWNMTSSDGELRANLDKIESGQPIGNPTATGFVFQGAASATYVYMAIRRPNKPPSSGNDVFTAVLNLGNTVAGITYDVGKSPDMMFGKSLSGAGTIFVDRPRGLGVQTASTSSLQLDSTSTAAETSGTSLRQYDWQGGNWNALTTNPITWIFKRAPGFFDIVCYTGTGANGNVVSHNLGVTPELIICKARSAAEDYWRVFFSMSASQYSWVNLNTTEGVQNSSYGAILGAAPTSSNMTLAWFASFYSVNTAGVNYVAYLFASRPGISKIGTYTGNGSTQTIDCSFSAGARFVLIKRTEGTGDWYVWDTTRGIIGANDPHLSMNSTAAEVTTNDSVDPVSSGFAVNQNAATNINVSNVAYLYLAIA